jgi:4,5-dihydroxyphthalate decarboxylase
VTNIKLKVACWDYDRTRPLIDNRVQVEGVQAEYIVLRPREAFTRMLEYEEFDVSEVSLSSFARLKANGDDRFVGIPVALSKMFRHSCIYVRTGAGIQTPADLRGKRIGVTHLDSTGIVFIKGFLRDDFDVQPHELKWVVGGLDKPQLASKAYDFSSHGDVQYLDERQTLTEEFQAGRLDALISNHIPSLFLRRDPQISRLFENFRSVEADYYRRTGIFPVMHVMAMRASLHRKYPWLAEHILQAFSLSKGIAMNGLYDTDALRLSLPWLIDHLEETWACLGEDYWSYGVTPNRATFDALCRFQFEQGLVGRQIDAAALFPSFNVAR